MGANPQSSRHVRRTALSESKERQDLSKELEWSSKLVKKALETYWATPSYVSAEAEAANTKLEPPPLRGDLVPIFQRYGYLETPIIGLDQFINSGEVHSVFGLSNWLTELPRMSEVYRIMRPALRLASEIIECDEYMGWWMHVREGEPVRRSRASPVFLTCTKRGYNVDDLRKALLLFGERVRFTWLCPEAMGGNHAFSIGNIPGFLQVLGCNGARSVLKKKYLRASNPIIALPISYYHRLLSSSNFTAAQNLRFQFLLAKMLLHELGHCWYTYWHGPLRKSRWKAPSREVKAFEHDLFPEMGFSLEWSIFGANVSTLDFGKHGCTTVGPVVATRPQDEYPIITPGLAFVSTEWLSRWFQTDTWEDASRIRKRMNLITIDHHPKIFQIVRFQNGALRTCIEIDAEALNDCTQKDAGHITTTIGAMSASQHCSVASWYEEIWYKEARGALNMGKLPKLYCQPSPTYGHLLESCDKPLWIASRPYPQVPQALCRWFSLRRRSRSDLREKG